MYAYNICIYIPTCIRGNFISFYIHLYVDAHARFFVYTCHTVNFQ